VAADELESKLRDYFDAAHAPGALDGKTKELMHIALVLAMRCEP
jgi:alkylhydroperoxidase/carboxymuconolactone decarboxylase family protein YurZ